MKNQIKNLNEFQVISNDNGLSTLDVTSGMNGYPTPYRGLIAKGFKDFKAAQSFAEQTGGEIKLAHYKAGWHNCELKGDAHEALSYHAYLSDLGDNYYEADADYDNFQVYLADAVGDADTKEGLAKVAEMISNFQKLVTEVEKASDDEVVITCGDGYSETIKKEMMEYSEDGHTYFIGVFLDKDEISEEEE